MNKLLPLLLAATLAAACGEKPPALLFSGAELPVGNAGAPYSQTLTATGGVAPLSYEAADLGLPPGLTITSGGTLAGTPQSGGTFTFSVRAIDSAEQIATARFSVELYANAPPAIVTAALGDGEVGHAYSFDLAGEAGAAPLAWAATGLPGWLTLSSAGRLSGTPDAEGTFDLAVTVTDAHGQKAERSLTLKVHPAVSISSTALADAYTDAPYSQTLAAGGGKAPYTWAIVTGTLPDGISLAATGAFSGTATAVISRTVTVQVTDAVGGSAQQALTLAAYAPPQLTTSALADGTVGIAYAQPLATAGGKAPVGVTVAGTLPAGLAFDGQSVSGTPSAAGTSDLGFTATDANGRTASKTLRLSVFSVTVGTSSLPSAYAGTPYSGSVVAMGGSTPYTFTVSAGALPAGISLASSGALTGTPTSAGIASFTVRVTDSGGRTATRALSLEVLAPLSVTTSALADGYVTRAYSATLAAAGGAAPYSFTQVGGVLPAGIALASSGALTGTPNASSTSSFTVKVTDANGVAAQRALSLSTYLVPAVTSTVLADGYTGRVYSAAISATGGKGALTLSRSGGTLPAGLSLASGGALSGTPSASGASSFSIVATDSNGVASPEQPLAVTIYAPPVVTTTTLPDAYTSETYASTLTTSGGKAPLSWQLASGSLPAGVTLSGSGAVGGRPTATGSFSFSVVAIDANGLTSPARALQLRSFDPPSLNNSALPDAYTDVAYSQTIFVYGGAAPYQWVQTAGVIPSGLALSTAGVVSGQATGSEGASFTVRVTDANGRTATATKTLSTYEPPRLLTTTVGDAYNSEAYEQLFAASGGKGSLTWSLYGSAPRGVVNYTDGALRGTPNDAAGAYTITQTVTDANGRTASRQYTIGLYDQLSYGSSLYLDAQVNQPYQAFLGATGGKSPLAYAVTAGSLPAGMNLDPATGNFSGTPTVVGNTPFTVTVTEAGGRTIAGDFTMRVSAAAAAALFDVAHWNLEWFGDPANGPTDDALQVQNATGVIADAGYPLWGMVEIQDVNDFNTMVAGLPGYAGFLANDPSVTSGSAFYSASEQKVGVLYDTSKVQVLGAQVILTAYDATFAGRPPLRVDTRVTVDGTTQDLTLIVLHLKAFATSTDWQKRADAAAALKSYLDSTLPSATVLVVGDWNDDVDQSIVTGLDTPFRNFVNDTVNYTYETAPLSAAGVPSTTGYPDIIDHHLASNELNALVAAPAQVIRPDLWPTPVANYGTTTSDHYPVVSHYDLSGNGGGGGGGGGGPPVYLNEVLFDEPTETLPDGGFGSNFDKEFVEVRNAGSAVADLSGWQLFDGSTTRHTFAPGTSLAPGKAIVVFGGASALAGAPANALAASTGTLSLHPSDGVYLYDSNVALRDSYSWTANWGDGISANRSPEGAADGGWVMHNSISSRLASPGVRSDGGAW